MKEVNDLQQLPIVLMVGFFFLLVKLSLFLEDNNLELFGGHFYASVLYFN